MIVFASIAELRSRVYLRWLHNCECICIDYSIERIYVDCST